MFEKVYIKENSGLVLVRLLLFVLQLFCFLFSIKSVKAVLLLLVLVLLLLLFTDIWTNYTPQASVRGVLNTHHVQYDVFLDHLLA